MTEEEIKEKARQARRAYDREWAKKNPEKIKAIKKRYWEKKAKQLIEHEEANNE